MLKNILNLEGTQKLSKTELKGIKGASAPSCIYPKKPKLIIDGSGEPVWVCL